MVCLHTKYPYYQLYFQILFSKIHTLLEIHNTDLESNCLGVEVMILHFTFFEISEYISGVSVKLMRVASYTQYFLNSIDVYFYMLHSEFKNRNDNCFHIREHNTDKQLEDYGYF